MRIVGIEGLTQDQIRGEILKGGKFVLYEYCMSLIVVTFRRASDIYFVRAGERAILRGLGYALISLLAGWWRFPRGPAHTLQAMRTSLAGGRDVTPLVFNQWTGGFAPDTARPPAVPTRAAAGVSGRGTVRGTGGRVAALDEAPYASVSHPVADAAARAANQRR